MTPKSVETQNGQYRAKQAAMPGVCNEWMGSAKAKVHSELYGNVQSSTEMIEPAARP